MAPISNIGPKTSWAARDRPEQNLEAKFSHRNNLPEIVAGRRRRPPTCNVQPPREAAAVVLRNQCATRRMLIVPPRAREAASGRPPSAQPCANHRPPSATIARAAKITARQERRTVARGLPIQSRNQCAGQCTSLGRPLCSSCAASAWLRPVSRGNRHFTVGGGILRQSGPRPEGRLLRQPALEGLTRSAQTDSPRQVGRNKFRRSKPAAAFEERKGAAHLDARVRVKCCDCEL
ncbi:7-ethoxycoumarin O-deethylase-like [Dorcoceras hygrometricum]|uniref:7-ethoxycoumarin O-deethylase-like n=1 Tax=Dorcoceras hygrometricum TaxID=472368 RepID=A0A2Z7CSY3_9LAMI|nr:7-ethoxycoumarin O-deethylase-like [Dorcoceras hygrometricum]